MEQEPNFDVLERLPRLRLGAAQTYLYAYDITSQGVYFIEAKEDGTSSGQPNFVTSGIILKAAGPSFRADEIGKLMAQVALDNIVDVYRESLVAC